MGLPVIRQEYNTKDLAPTHPALRLVADCEQVLSCHTSRRLMVMERVEGEGLARVSTKLAEYKDQFYLSLAGNISKSEKKARLREYGHLNMSNEEVEKFSKVVIN